MVDTRVSKTRDPKPIVGVRFSPAAPEFMEEFSDLEVQLAKFSKLISVFPEEEREKIFSALELSRESHASQKRKNGADYVVHLVRVANILLEEVDVKKPQLICAALLHDTLEDTSLSLESIKSSFGGEVADLVLTLSKKPDEPSAAYLARAIGTSEEATLIKMCDRLDNCRDLVGVTSQQPEFAQRQIAEVERFYLPYTRRSAPYFDRQLRYNIGLAKERLKSR